MPTLLHAAPPWPEPAIDPRRRGLLTITLCTPMAAVGALFAPSASLAQTAAPAPLPQAAAAPGGYHTSEHTAAYYSSLRY